MTKTILTGLGGLILGALLTMFIMFQMAPGMMLIEDESQYNFEESVAKFEASVKEHGWKLPATHDLQKTMKKFDYDVKSVKVFELCHPDHAMKILEADDERIVSTMMPCRVAIYEKNDGKTYFSRMNSKLMASTMGELINSVMAEAADQNEEILQVLFKK